jgi:hypothetical protein
MSTHALPKALLAGAVLIGGCDKNDTPDEKVHEARVEHREEVREASRENDPDQRAKEVAEANAELAQEHAEAYENVERDADDDRAGDDRAGDDRDRFQALEDETDSAFVQRANGRIAAIQKELDSLDSAKRADDDAHDVEEQLAEARKDLAEFKGDRLPDDGKLGVTVAINAAERELDRLEAE